MRYWRRSSWRPPIRSKSSNPIVGCRY
jgi:hypothetical protein